MDGGIELKPCHLDKRQNILILDRCRWIDWSEPLRVDNELNLHERIAHARRMKNLISLPF